MNSGFRRKIMKKMFFYLAVIILTMAILNVPSPCKAEDIPADKTVNDTASSCKILDYFEIQVRNLNFGLLQKPTDSELNPDNLQQISRYTLGSDLRPDIKISIPRLEISCKPRLELRWKHWREGPDKGDSDIDSDTFVNEWLIRVALLENLFISYGREDLQWGPSFLLSPSNPFYSNNGRNHPKSEVAGAGYARLVLIPDQRWTISLIANLDKGHKDLKQKFKKNYAAKVDYIAEKAYFSAILSKQDSEDTRFGGFCSWNISDAGLLYSEGSFDKDAVEILVGASYTMPEGATFNLEYYHNGDGIRNGSLALHLADLETDIARRNLWRKNYLFLQYYDHDMMDNWSVLFRGTAGLDDHSYAILTYGDYNIGDHSQLFAEANIFQGDRESEFGSLLDYSFMVGIEFSF